MERAERTLNDYVVTEQLAGCFDDALSLIGSAVGANTSNDDTEHVDLDGTLFAKLFNLEP